MKKLRFFLCALLGHRSLVINQTKAFADIECERCGKQQRVVRPRQ